MAAARLDARGVIVNCPQCGRPNRLPYATLGRQTRCGSCKTMLPLPSTPIAISDSDVFDAASHGALPLLVDFWAPWCGPCRMVAPELERVAKNRAGDYLVVKVNTDEASTLAARFRIQSIPTMTVVSDGREIARAAGARPAAEIEAFVAQALASSTRTQA